MRTEQWTGDFEIDVASIKALLHVDEPRITNHEISI